MKLLLPLSHSASGKRRGDHRFKVHNQTGFGIGMAGVVLTASLVAAVFGATASASSAADTDGDVGFVYGGSTVPQSLDASDADANKPVLRSSMVAIFTAATPNLRGADSFLKKEEEDFGILHDASVLAVGAKDSPPEDDVDNEAVTMAHDSNTCDMSTMVSPNFCRTRDSFIYKEGCVSGNNIRWLTGQTRESCADACVTEGPSCVGIEYASVGNSSIQKNICSLSSSIITAGCNNGKYQLDLYVKLPQTLQVSGKSFIYKPGCVAGNNLKFLRGKTLQQCAQECLDHGADCLGVEYFVEDETEFGLERKRGDCILNSSVNTVGCGFKMIYFLERIVLVSCPVLDYNGDLSMNRQCICTSSTFSQKVLVEDKNYQEQGYACTHPKYSDCSGDRKKRTAIQGRSPVTGVWSYDICTLPDYATCNQMSDCDIYGSTPPRMGCKCVEAHQSCYPCEIVCDEKQCIPNGGATAGHECLGHANCASGRCNPSGICD